MWVYLVVLDVIRVGVINVDVINVHGIGAGGD